jgi:FMN phosphatase YigB (HAD superfamily)/SAM-dependent methyltransferase
MRNVGEASAGSEKTGTPADARPSVGVLFDVDGTLYHQRMLQAIMALRLILALLVHPVRTVREVRVLAAFRHAQEWLRDHQVAGELEPDAQVIRTAEVTGKPHQAVRATVARWMQEAPQRLLPLCARRGMIRRIRRWHRLGIPMGVYSDYRAEAKLRSLGVESLLRPVVCSTDPDVRAFKPDPRGYQAAAARMGLRPKDMIYVGDREAVDAVGANRAGMLAAIIGLRGMGRRRNRDVLSLKRLDAHILGAAENPESPACWVCGSLLTLPWRPSTLRHPVGPTSWRVTDSMYGQTAALRKCSRCSFVFADPLPSPDLVDCYRNMDDEEYQGSAGPRCVQMRSIIQTALRQHPQAQTLLDVGAGTGLLLLEAQAAGLHAEGVEPSRWCVETAAKTNGVELRCGTLQEYSDRLGHYDLVMLVDVIEHVSDPVGLLRQAADRLAPGGRLVIVTPDIASALARLMGRRWWHHRVAHVGYFSLATMAWALDQGGLSEVAHASAGWRFPVPYVCKRLVRYLPSPPFNWVLNRLGASRFMAQRQVTLNLHDSFLFIAKRKDDA